MFVGMVSALDEGYLHYPAIIQQALRYLRAQDFTKMPDGTYTVDGTDIKASVQRYMTKPAAECRPESHQKFVDIQFIAEGEDCMGWCPLSPSLTVSEPYDAQKDVGFFEKLVPDSDVVLSPGAFAVLYPEDVHRPKGAVDGKPVHVTKVVVKIPVDAL